jgi:hypothetical protein
MFRNSVHDSHKRVPKKAHVMNRFKIDEILLIINNGYLKLHLTVSGYNRS